MYEESEKKSFNSDILLLILKLVLLAIFIFILCWLFIGNKKNDNVIKETDENFIQNINMMKESAFEYYTSSKLPQKIGDTSKLSLNDMINQKLLIDFTNNGKTCNLDESYVQATKTADENYALKVNLKCDKEEDFIVTTIEKKETACVTCPTTNNTSNENNTVKEDNTSTNTNNNTSTNNSNNTNKVTQNKKPVNSSNTTNNSANENSSSSNSKVTTTVVTKVTYTYKYYNFCNTCNNEPATKPEEKPKNKMYEVYSYTDWVDGYLSGNDYENKCEQQNTYNYCKVGVNNFYAACYINSGYSNSNFSSVFTVSQLNSSNIEVYETIPSYYTSDSDYAAFINQMKAANAKDANNVVDTYTNMKNASLKANNFTFTTSGVYQAGNTKKIDVRVHINNYNGITPYYSKYLNQNVYFVPTKYTIKYRWLNTCIKDTESNKNKYPGYQAFEKSTANVCKHRQKIYKWVNESELNSYLQKGWTKTGNTKDDII